MSATLIEAGLMTRRDIGFGTHAFSPGEYVSITEDDGDIHTFRVISVEAAT